MVHTGKGIKRLLAGGLLFTLLAGCGGGGGGRGEGSRGSGNNSATTISGIATDDPLSGATVTLQSPDGGQITLGTTGSDGSFSLEVQGAEIANGYELFVTGGQIGNESFTGELRAQYATSDDRAAANVTLITTMVSRLVDQETSGTFIERRNAVIQRLASIGIFNPSEWNSTAPSGVSLELLRHDITQQGFDTVITKVVSDLGDSDVSIDNMPYFPDAHGGLASVSVPDADASGKITAFIGDSVVTGAAQVNVMGNASTVYTFTLLNGPVGMSVSESTGEISYNVPAGATTGSIPFTIRVAGDAGHRDISGEIYVV